MMKLNSFIKKMKMLCKGNGNLLSNFRSRRIPRLSFVRSYNIPSIFNY